MTKNRTKVDLKTSFFSHKQLNYSNYTAFGIPRRQQHITGIIILFIFSFSISSSCSSRSSSPRSCSISVALRYYKLYCSKDKKTHLKKMIINDNKYQIWTMMTKYIRVFHMNMSWHPQVYSTTSGLCCIQTLFFPRKTLE